jgi:hypothetical protein
LVRRNQRWLGARTASDRLALCAGPIAATAQTAGHHQDGALSVDSYGRQRPEQNPRCALTGLPVEHNVVVRDASEVATSAWRVPVSGALVFGPARPEHGTGLRARLDVDGLVLKVGISTGERLPAAWAPAVTLPSPINRWPRRTAPPDDMPGPADFRTGTSGWVSGSVTPITTASTTIRERSLCRVTLPVAHCCVRPMG